MKVAAYQAPLLAAGSMDAYRLIRQRIEQCEAEGIALLCCPEAILGGLADYADDPDSFAVATDRIDAALAPLMSDTVTTIVGFTERTDTGLLHNSAAVCHRRTIAGVYRKIHPAINRSVYTPGAATPVFRAGPLTFGIVICNDSNFPELADRIAALGATLLFVLSNNGMPPRKGGRELVDLSRRVDVACAKRNHMWVIRADVAGRAGELVSYGSSAIVDPDGTVRQSARDSIEDLLVCDLALPQTPT